MYRITAYNVTKKTVLQVPPDSKTISHIVLVLKLKIRPEAPGPRYCISFCFWGCGDRFLSYGSGLISTSFFVVVVSGVS